MKRNVTQFDRAKGFHIAQSPPAVNVAQSLRRAFTLLEVMFTIAIFGIGLIAILSIFPVAGRMQKNTIDDVITQQVKRNTIAMMEAKGFEQTDLAGVTRDGNVQPVVPASVLGYPSSLNTRWPLNARSYPSTQPLVDLDGKVNRSFFWVPLVRDANAGVGSPNWQVFIFTLVGKKNTNYPRFGSTNEWANPQDGEDGENNFVGPPEYAVPGVRRMDDVSVSNSDPTRLEFDDGNDYDDDGLPDQVLVGDWILTNDGVIYNVIAADIDGVNVSGRADDTAVDSLWYSPPPSPGDASPTRAILLVPNAVKSP